MGVGWLLMICRFMRYSMFLKSEFKSHQENNDIGDTSRISFSHDSDVTGPGAIESMDIDSENIPFVDPKNVPPSSVKDTLCSLEYARKNSIERTLVDHSVIFPSNARSLLSQYLISGRCLGNSTIGCRSVRSLS